MIRAPALVGALAAAYGGGEARTAAGKFALIVSHRLQIPFYKRAGFPRNSANLCGRLVKSRRETSMR
jgi:hypothetical protein